MRISHQLEFVSLQAVKVMRPELANNFREILETLESKLSKVLRKLVTFGAKSANDQAFSLKPPTRRLSDQVVKRFKFVILKESLDSAIQDLELWRRLFDPSWFLLIKAASPALMNEVAMRSGKGSLVKDFPAASGLQVQSQDDEQTRIFITASELETRQIIDQHLSFSKVSLGTRKGKHYILDPLDRPEGSEAAIFPRHVRTLAKKLSSTEPTMSNLLSCKGIIKDTSQYTMVFSIPNGLNNPHSLRALLEKAPLPLSERFRIAKDLANSINYVHSYGYVHKNIRPETVWRMTHRIPANNFTFLVGFEQFRHEDGRTQKIGDHSWEKNLYRHPERQGRNPQALYQMQHDIYSLGVCLLEIGMWW
jgi:hypothetical protein